jgi:DNA polymerase I-like protein with 3'-5' exonuclease and polymerase domains
VKLALLIEPEDHKFLPYIKPMLAMHQVAVIQKCPELISEITGRFDAGIVVREDFLKKLTLASPGSNLENYAGSLLKFGGKEFVVLDPLEQLIKTRAGEFLSKRYLSKILTPNKWFRQTPFSWEIAKDDTISSLYSDFSGADVIAVDIETTTDDTHAITCVGYCGIWFTDNGIRTHSIVIPFTDMFWVEWVRKFNKLPQPKIFQNGQFDNIYFLRFGCPVENWLFDTQEFFHAWYCELPKRLDAISAFLLRDVYYWKKEGKTGNLEDYYRYNAKDTWATANSWLSAIGEAPAWVTRNYLEKFPLVYPCLATAVEGLLVDQAGKERMIEEQTPKLEQSLDRLRKRIGRPAFKPNSPKQVLSLVHALGYAKETKVKDHSTGGYKDSTGEKILLKIAKKHPLPQLLITDILNYRESRKLLSTYIECELFGGRLLYSLSPSGTDTWRLASKGSSFFGKGTQIQNMPPYVKGMLRADQGFHLFEIDNKNSEGYCVGYLSGDENLIQTLNSGKDFHCLNASKFFGIPYDELFDDSLGKVLQDAIRSLSKRVNHGANYNMAETVLIETMGAENVLRAKQLLKLPAEWGLRQVASFLLEQYEKAYPGVKGAWYDYIKASVKLTHTLVSVLGTTRYCFGEPWANKPDLNAYVAHAPQHLSVGIINRGFRRVFWKIQVPNWPDFRLKAQIHDSILGQYRVGRTDFVESANKLMVQTILVVDCKGKEREMTIPTDIKGGAELWKDLRKWKDVRKTEQERRAA